MLTAAWFVEFLAGPLRPILLLLMGAVVFVLLIAAANVGRADPIASLKAE